MEYLVAAVILYFIFWTVGNLVTLLSGAEEGSAPGQQRRRGSSAPRGWEGPSPRQQTGAARDEPTFWGEDIEEATWHDIDGPVSSEQEASR